ncbi:IS5 family transposase [Streptomyces qaidamensis]|uniref:IS5 family transposase n=1 Tax=Streptomyces qaidamensis TaxID=1783515 RepID=UPI003654A07E
MRDYVRGLLGRATRKNGWQLAEWAGHRTPDGFQRLLNSSVWDADALRDDVRAYVAERLGPGGVLIIDAVAVRHRLRQPQGCKRGPLTEPNPTDRGKNGSKILVTDRNGLPLSLGISGANMHDSLGLKPLVRGIPPIRSRRGPRRRRPAKLHADKGYDYDHLRRWLRKRVIRHRIARKGMESSQRLGRHRWVVERTVSWLAGCRRLHRRYERKAEHFLAFVGIAAALISYRRLTN